MLVVDSTTPTGLGGRPVEEVVRGLTLRSARQERGSPPGPPVAGDEDDDVGEGGIREADQHLGDGL